MRQRDDVVGVAVPEIHRDADVAEREAPGLAEEHYVQQDRMHESPAAGDEVVLEHLTDGRICEESLVAWRHEAREQVGRLFRVGRDQPESATASGGPPPPSGARPPTAPGGDLRS